MWVRSVATVPASAESLSEALGRLSPDTLAALARAASRDGYHLHAHLGRPVGRDEITTFHIRWWNDRDPSLTPALNGELALRPLSAQVTELAITAEYQCHAILRELADSMFLRRTAESVVKAFLDSLVGRLESAADALAVTGAPNAGLSDRNPIAISSPIATRTARGPETRGPSSPSRRLRGGLG